jgi:biofilm PGA synthesis N-glycosyltransferase PgaC
MTEPYAIVTPAYNEAGLIHATVESVLAQTVRPVQWVIVDDGSTDDTPTIVERYMKGSPWIRCHRRQRADGQTYFASNVHAIMEGVRLLQDLPFEFLAILDADISLPRDYYENILARFHHDPKLGIASGIYDNLIGGRRHKVLNDRRSTPKAIQVFRRMCFDDIGGFLPLPHGGEDTCACIMARMKGWKTWSFPDITAVHLRPTGTAGARNIVIARFRQGLCEYGLATHPLFMIVKSLRRCVLERPLLFGGILRLVGYAYGYIRREPRQLSVEAARQLRREQLGRVLLLNRMPRRNRVDGDPL